MEIGLSQVTWDNTPFDQLSERQFAIGVSAIMWNWIYLDNNYFQYQSGFLTEEAWEVYEKNIRRAHGDCKIRWIYESYRRDVARSSFNALLESLDDPCGPEDLIPPQQLIDKLYGNED
jgi:hypothetical protein